MLLYDHLRGLDHAAAEHVLLVSPLLCEMVHVAMCEYTWYKLHMCVPVPVYEHMHAFVCAHVYVVCVESFSDSI